MDVLVGIANLVVLLFIIESWVTGRIPAALARATAERVDERLNDPANPANARLDRLERLADEIGGRPRRTRHPPERARHAARRARDSRVSDLDARLDRVDAQVAVLNAQTSQQINDLDRRVRERLRGLERRELAPEAEAGGAAEGIS